MNPKSSVSAAEKADKMITFVTLYKYGLTDNPEILNGFSNSYKQTRTSGKHAVQVTVSFLEEIYFKESLGKLQDIVRQH